MNVTQNIDTQRPNRYFCVILELRMWIVIRNKKFLKLDAKGVYVNNYFLDFF